MKTIVSDAAIDRVAMTLRCDEPAIRAVLEVECAGQGFLSDGRPKILFERHVFSRRTNREYDLTHPDISNRVPGGYRGGPEEYMRLYAAVQLDATAAVESASWGTAQLMGFNWALTGEKSLMGFILAMHNSADAHLFLFAQFLKNTNLDDELRRHDWAGFARGFNGLAYRQNDYDTKLAAAWRKHGGA